MKTGCVLVLYNPDKLLLNQCLESLVRQVDKIVIVDNSPVHTINIDFEKYAALCIYHALAENMGIAFAQNIGIEILKADDHYDYLLFMDQDSIAPPNLVEALLSESLKLQNESILVGAIGPRAVNRQDSSEYRGMIMAGKKIDESITEVNELISSGSMIPFANFDSVGVMDAELFIDGVDHEWCWRAKYKENKRFFICETVKLSHQLGEGDRYLLGKRISISTPFRTYYQYRNYFILLRREYVPLYWKLSNGFKYIIKLFYFPLFVSPRIGYLKNIWRGIYSGMFIANK